MQQQNDGKMLSNGIVIGARQLDAHLAQNMNLRLSADGNFFSSDSSGFGEYDGILSGSDYPGQQVNTAQSASSGASEGRLIDPTEDPWSGAGASEVKEDSLVADPEYVGVGRTVRNRHPSRGRSREQGRGTPQKIQLRGSRVEVAGPVSPSLYLRPIRRESICERVLKFFGFR